jgi:hypothetical protein
MEGTKMIKEDVFKGPKQIFFLYVTNVKQKLFLRDQQTN